MSEGAAAPITNMAILNPGGMGAGSAAGPALMGSVSFSNFPSLFVGFSTAGGLIDIASGHLEKVYPELGAKVFGKSNFLPPQAMAGFNDGLLKGGQGADAGMGSPNAGGGADAGASHHHPANDHAPMQQQGGADHHHPTASHGADSGHSNVADPNLRFKLEHDPDFARQLASNPNSHTAGAEPGPIQQHSFDHQGHAQGPVHQDHAPSAAAYSNHDPILAARLGIPMEELNYKLSLNPDAGRALQADPNNFVPTNSGHGPDYTPPVHNRSRELVHSHE